MKSLQRILEVILILAISACIPSTLKVKTDYNPETNFEGFKTYDWEEAPVGVIGEPKVDLEQLKAIVRDVADGELSAKGVVRKTSGSPDFLIHFHATLDKKETSMHMRGRYFDPYYKRERAAKVNVYEWDQGTLVLDFVDTGTRKYIWTGSATDRFNFTASPEQNAERVNEAIKEILKGFPPPKRKPGSS